MFEPAGNRRLSHEASASRFAGRDAAQAFQRHLAIQFQVFSDVDFTETAASVELPGSKAVPSV